MQEEIRQIIRCKQKYKQKIGRKMRENDLRQAWQEVYTTIEQEMKKLLACNHGDDLTFDQIN